MVSLSTRLGRTTTKVPLPLHGNELAFRSREPEEGISTKLLRKVNVFLWC